MFVLCDKTQQLLYTHIPDLIIVLNSDKVNILLFLMWYLLRVQSWCPLLIFLEEHWLLFFLSVSSFCFSLPFVIFLKKKDYTFYIQYIWRERGHLTLLLLHGGGKLLFLSGGRENTMLNIDYLDSMLQKGCKYASEVQSKIHNWFYYFLLTVSETVEYSGHR